MFDHISIKAKDLAKSKKFYTAALGALGQGVRYEDDSAVGYGTKGGPSLWIAATPPNGTTHIAFTAANRAAVDAFYKAAIAAGGKDNGKPGLRPQYHKDYYGAFVHDPDGNNVEAVTQKPE
jgi:catechol 2,3-dioxygenase-like lactoylglutathione lyase family enzyme